MLTQQNNQNPNGVKGNAKPSSRTSPDGRLSTQQCTFDRHPVTTCNTREKMKIATWNVSTMYQAGKQEWGLISWVWQMSDGCSLGDSVQGPYADLFRSQERSQTWHRFATQQSGLEVSSSFSLLLVSLYFLLYFFSTILYSILLISINLPLQKKEKKSQC